MLAGQRGLSVQVDRSPVPALRHDTSQTSLPSIHRWRRPILPGGASRFLPTRFHAHLVLGLARWASIVLHAGALLVAAHFATCLSLRCCIEPTRADQHEHHHRQASHGTNSSHFPVVFTSARTVDRPLQAADASFRGCTDRTASLRSPSGLPPCRCRHSVQRLHRSPYDRRARTYRARAPAGRRRVSWCGPPPID